MDHLVDLPLVLLLLSSGIVLIFLNTSLDVLHLLKIASGLSMPNGVAFKDGSLYVAEVNRLWRYDNIEASLAAVPKPVLLNESFPPDRHHGWKFIAFGPDGWLYVPVGAPCNICDRDTDKRYASIIRIRRDGTAPEVYAHGVRNTVGFAWHPQTKALWFTDNGRDMLGRSASASPPRARTSPRKRRPSARARTSR